MSNFNPQDIINRRAGGGRGSYHDVARAAQGIKTTIEEELTVAEGRYITDGECEAMDCIAMKLARIIHRTSEHDLDSWQDIAGYATLVVNYIKQQEAKTNR